ncbi:hypothetical protein PENSUB_12272 [Penicillium subrubescens]|uniref:Uncharacterized protein n=1 Tax=Penicillium subrubescens TaxID=1316194 RepID=A0A1Q5SYW5_9EURO|nr:hypothetical protein PENSUB_12272 [Penicillium subrubescens]
MKSLIRRLEHLARFRMTRELANAGVRPGTLSSLISIQVKNVRESQKVSDEPEEWLPPAEIGEWITGIHEVPEKTMFRIIIENRPN